MDQCQVSGTSSASGSCDDAFMNCMYAVAEQCDAPPQECIVSGCSGQVCAAQEVMTTCEWLPEYACYQDLGECGNFGPGGACTWNPTPALEQCLDNASGGGEPDSNGALD